LKARLENVVGCFSSSEAFEVLVYPSIEELTTVSSDACWVHIETCPDFVVHYQDMDLSSPVSIELIPSDDSPVMFSIENSNAPSACREVSFTESFVCEPVCCSFAPVGKIDLQVCSGDNLDLEVVLEGNCPNEVQWSNGLLGTSINTGDLVNNTCQPVEVEFMAVIESTQDCPQQIQTFTITVLPLPSVNNIEVNKNDCKN